MARILFAPFFDTGHLNATFLLARQLQSRGHEVLYVSIPDVGAVIEREGFRFTPVLEEHLPKGFWQEREARRARLSGWRLVQEWRESTAVVTQALRSVLKGAVDGRLLGLAPDLVVFDNLLPEVGIL